MDSVAVNVVSAHCDECIYLYPNFLAHFPVICREISPALHSGYGRFGSGHRFSLRIVYRVFLIVRVTIPGRHLLLSSTGNVCSSKQTAAWVRQRHHRLPPKPGHPQEFLPGGLIVPQMCDAQEGHNLGQEMPLLYDLAV